MSSSAGRNSRCFAPWASGVAMGLACGVVAALVAVVPALRSPGADVPYASLALTLAAIVAGGLAWTLLAAAAALAGSLLPALRKE